MKVEEIPPGGELTVIILSSNWWVGGGEFIKESSIFDSSIGAVGERELIREISDFDSATGAEGGKEFIEEISFRSEIKEIFSVGGESIEEEYIWGGRMEEEEVEDIRIFSMRRIISTRINIQKNDEKISKKYFQMKRFLSINNSHTNSMILVSLYKICNLFQHFYSKQTYNFISNKP